MDYVDVRDESDVDKMDIDAVFNWLDGRQINYQLYSLDEMKQLIRVALRSTKRESSDVKDLFRSKTAVSDIKEVLTHDKDLRDHIGSFYDELLNTLRKKPNWTYLYKYLSTWCGCGDIVTKLNEHKDELQRKDCPIVIAGETSAGKSCFLNLLLGEKVLPVSLLCATSTICLVHPIASGEVPYFTVDGQRNPVENKDELIGKLKTILTARHETEKIKQVDVYIEVPLVGENKHIIFVDTPGVGESEQMSDKVFEYLPNAAAFIYVLNSANAGGVQEDKLVQIFKKVEEMNQSSCLFSFDPMCTMFVCNKWDVIEERTKREEGTEDKVWDDTLLKLRHFLPECQWENQLYKMSTTEAIRYMENDMNDSDKYSKLKIGLKKLLYKSQTSKSNMHLRWLRSFMQQVSVYVSARKHGVVATEAERIRKHEEIDMKLKKAEEDTELVKNRLIESCKRKLSAMTHAVHTFLNEDDVQKRLKTCASELLHSITAPDDDAFQYIATKHIMKIVGQEIEAWEHDSGFWKRTVEDMRCEMEKEFGLLDDECCVAEEAIECRKLAFKGFDTSSLWEKLHNGFQSVQNGFTAILNGRQYMVGRIIKKSVIQIAKFVHREAYLRHLLKVVAKECFSEESIHKSIKESLFSQIKRKIISQCDKHILCRIKACTVLNECILQDTRTQSEITQETSEIHEELLRLKAKLNNHEKKSTGLQNSSHTSL
ncbi:transmembrane GTPase fzo-like isoform X2 [Dreissena polymorpha]|uniref:transmembrane GTPase fzo-like isoform X2 n=1 Tax=Dreissena polymorpha TaxID=45954 RepID=UPI0022642B38|nr:transmembrane GTPase fzo-like isoform X2 [Dreissena polymorpha]